ncbi:MAG: hypothetical protein ACREMY_33285, partial [bacterium]
PLTGEPYLAGITGPGIVGTLGGFQPDISPPAITNDYDSFVARFDPQLSTTDSVTPAPFSFPTQSGVSPGTAVTTPSTRLYGNTAPVPISVVNGSYSLDGSAFTTSNDTLQPGQAVRLQHTASSMSGGNTQTVLTVGGVSGTFDSVAQSGVTTTPSAFSFAARNSAVPGIWISSDPITVQSTNAPAPISVTGGEYSIDGGAFTSDPGVVNSGQRVIAAHTTASAPDTQTDTTVTIGGLGSTFTTVTEPLNVVPHAFAFFPYRPPAYALAADADYESSPATITDINGPAPISVAGGQYRINAGAWTANPGTVNNLDYVQAKLHAGAAGTSTSATVTIGGV